MPAGSIYVYRNYDFDDPDQPYRRMMATDPLGLADLHVQSSVKSSAWLEAHGVSKDHQLFTSVNEPHIWSDETPHNVAVYGARFLNGLHAHGLHGGWPELSVGWPGNGRNASLGNPGSKDPPHWAWAQPAIEAMNDGDYLTVHEYWADGGAREMWGWWGGRVLQCPYHVRILVTETGIDMGVKYPQLDVYKGWLALPGTTDEKARRYTDELWDYMGLMAEDSRVRGVFPFTYDGAGDKWAWFEQRNEQLQAAHRRKWALEGIPHPRPYNPGDDPDPPPTWPPDPDPLPEPEFAVEYVVGGPYIVGSYPQKGAMLVLRDPWGNTTHCTAGDKPEYGPGGFLFTAIPGYASTIVAGGQDYRVEVKPGNTSKVTFGTIPDPIEPPPDPDPDPEPGEYHIEYAPGLPLVVGNYTRAGADMLLRDPWGNEQRVRSGSKPEYGSGGFEFIGIVGGQVYTLIVDDVVWPVETMAGMIATIKWS